MFRKLFWGLIAFNLMLLSNSCTEEGPQAIRYGQDQCVYCKMTVSDPRFGTQILTKKGRALNFDDLQCMVAHVKADEVNEGDISEYYLPDYTNNNQLLPAKEMVLLKSESLRSPMRGDVAAFSALADLQEAQKVHGGEIIGWDELW